MPNDLHDLEQLRTAKARYCRLLDTKRFDELRDLLIPDATILIRGLDGEPLYQFASANDFTVAARDLFATTRTAHQVHHPEIEFRSPDEADGVWGMEDWHVPAGTDAESRARTLHGYGFYHETWRRDGNRWRLARMDLHRTVLFIGAGAA